MAAPPANSTSVEASPMEVTDPSQIEAPTEEPVVNAEPKDEGEETEIDFVEKVIDKQLVFEAPPLKPLPPPKKIVQKADFSLLEKSQTYSDLSSIQKTYMPKSKRLLLSGGYSNIPSDVFFRTQGYNVKASFHLTESWGFEVFHHGFSSSDRDEIDDIDYIQGERIKNLVPLSSFNGANLYFNTIYGKLSFNNSSIVPFEIYQLFGIGQATTINKTSAASMQVGIGNLFSLSRSNVFRVELVWALYTIEDLFGKKELTNSFFLNLNLGRFFPKPEYR